MVGHDAFKILHEFAVIQYFIHAVVACHEVNGCGRIQILLEIQLVVMTMVLEHTSQVNKHLAIAQKRPEVTNRFLSGIRVQVNDSRRWNIVQSHDVFQQHLRQPGTQHCLLNAFLRGNGQVALTTRYKHQPAAIPTPQACSFAVSPSQRCATLLVDPNSQTSGPPKNNGHTKSNQSERPNWDAISLSVAHLFKRHSSCSVTPCCFFHVVVTKQEFGLASTHFFHLVRRL